LILGRQRFHLLVQPVDPLPFVSAGAKIPH
jgi:hypothetical protein